MEAKRNYAGIPDEFAQLETAKVVLLPVPHEGAPGWSPGTEKGPKAFLEASERIGGYDVETDTEVYRQGIHLADALGGDTPEALVRTVHSTVKTYIKRNKFVTLFGGGHTLTIGAVRAFGECFDNLSVLQIDAHANLRERHKGSSVHPTCALHEAVQQTNLVQVGIRAMDPLERTLMDEERAFLAHDMVKDEYWTDKALELLTDKVYISLDLDALDPSIFPATDTPVPGGLFFYETLEFLRMVFEERNVVGFEMVGLAPIAHDKSSDFMAAKLYQKLLSYKFMGRSADDEYDNSYDAAYRGGGNQNKFENDED